VDQLSSAHMDKLLALASQISQEKSRAGDGEFAIEGMLNEGLWHILELKEANKDLAKVAEAQKQSMQQSKALTQSRDLEVAQDELAYYCKEERIARYSHTNLQCALVCF